MPKRRKSKWNKTKWMRSQTTMLRKLGWAGLAKATSTGQDCRLLPQWQSVWSRDARVSPTCSHTVAHTAHSFTR